MPLSRHGTGKEGLLAWFVPYFGILILFRNNTVLKYGGRNQDEYTGWPRKNTTLSITNFKEIRDLIKLTGTVMSRKFFFPLSWTLICLTNIHDSNVNKRLQHQWINEVTLASSPFISPRLSSSTSIVLRHVFHTRININDVILIHIHNIPPPKEKVLTI